MRWGRVSTCSSRARESTWVQVSTRFEDYGDPCRNLNLSRLAARSSWWRLCESWCWGWSCYFHFCDRQPVTELRSHLRRNPDGVWQHPAAGRAATEGSGSRWEVSEPCNPGRQQQRGYHRNTEAPGSCSGPLFGEPAFPSAFLSSTLYNPGNSIKPQSWCRITFRTERQPHIYGQQKARSTWIRPGVCPASPENTAVLPAKPTIS